MWGTSRRCSSAKQIDRSHRPRAEWCRLLHAGCFLQGRVLHVCARDGRRPIQIASQQGRTGWLWMHPACVPCLSGDLGSEHHVLVRTHSLWWPVARQQPSWDMCAGQSALLSRLRTGYTHTFIHIQSLLCTGYQGRCPVDHLIMLHNFSTTYLQKLLSNRKKIWWSFQFFGNFLYYTFNL